MTDALEIDGYHRGTHSFGELLRRHRTAAGLTQEALAERAGLSSRGIADLERGVRRAPYRGTVARLVEALDLDAAQREALVAASRRGLHKEERAVVQIPEPLTSLVGRERDIAAIGELVDHARLLTLVGPGGIGKTRLALELAAREARRYADGVGLVELAALSDPTLVPHAATSALGLQDIGSRAPTEALVEHLGRRNMLLILDNCEHLVQACAELVDRLIRTCTALRIVATSREVLGVQGEVTWSVPPLSVPPARADLTPEAVTSSESGRLFVDRACSAAPSFQLSAHNALDVGRVCQRLDGIPLALELAAARVKVLTVAQIAERLDHALGLLTTGGRLAPARQQTLRATLAWSYQLLSEPEQRLFERLSVFAGGLTLDAAEAVCAGDSVDGAWVLDGLTRLFDKSLLVVQEPASGPARYRLLEPIRQFAEEHLMARDEQNRFKDRHADFYVALAERSEPEIHRPSALAVMDMLDREHDNMRVALRWLLSIPDAERSQRLAAGMGGFWLYRGHVAEGEAWLRQALDVPGGDAPTLQRAKCLSPLPVFANTRGDLTRLEQTSQEELRVCRQLRDQVGEAFGLLHVAQAAVMGGDLDRAQRCYLDGVEVSRTIGNTAAETLNLVGLAKLAFEQGFVDEARAYAEDALSVVSEEGWTRGLAQANRILGQVCHRQGDHARARALLEASLKFSRKFGARWWTCGALIELGNFAVDQRDVSDARAVLSEGLQLAYELGDWPGMVAGLEGFGRLAVALDQPLDGLRLHAAAAAIRRQRALPGSGPLEQSITAVRASAGQAAVEAALAEGRVMRVQESVEYALNL